MADSTLLSYGRGGSAAATAVPVERRARAVKRDVKVLRQNAGSSGAWACSPISARTAVAIDSHSLLNPRFTLHLAHVTVGTGRTRL